jgi:hypothetical protein
MKNETIPGNEREDPLRPVALGFVVNPQIHALVEELRANVVAERQQELESALRRRIFGTEKAMPDER